MSASCAELPNILAWTHNCPDRRARDRDADLLGLRAGVPFDFELRFGETHPSGIALQLDVGARDSISAAITSGLLDSTWKGSLPIVWPNVEVFSRCRALEPFAGERMQSPPTAGALPSFAEARAALQGGQGADKR